MYNLNGRVLNEVLESNGFTKVVTPISKTEKFFNHFLPKSKKYKDTTHQHWLERIIDGIKYEVFDNDMFNVNQDKTVWMVKL
jgi:hypothetical protein